MTVDRILLSGSTVRISRPGVDVKSPPTLTGNHLALDSSWTPSEGPLAIGYVLGQSAASKFTVSFGTTYPGVPSIALFTFEGTQIVSTDYTYFHDSAGDNYTVPFWLWPSTTGFQVWPINNHDGNPNPWAAVARNWLWFAWPTW